jgi:membrane associated rhomboid family serine protease
VAYRRAGNPFDFGGRVPAAVGGLLVATVVVSLAGALGDQMGFPLRGLLLLQPAAVWRGEVWRLATWVLLEDSPVNLLLGGLVLWWFGRDLVDAWGPRRFLVTWFAIPAVAGALTCLLALLWPRLAASAHAGFWVALDALIVAWGVLHPFRQILLFFAVPVSGRALAAITVGATVLFALFLGVAAFVPHLLAEGLAWLHASGQGPGRWFRKLRWPRLRRRSRFEVIHVDRDPDRRWLN